MESWRKYARARDQLYHLMVQFRQLDESISKAHRTAELTQVLETMARVLDEAKIAFEHGEIMAVQIDRYTPLSLPGFAEQFPEMKNPYQGDKD